MLYACFWIYVVFFWFNDQEFTSQTLLLSAKEKQTLISVDDLFEDEIDPNEQEKTEAEEKRAEEKKEKAIHLIWRLQEFPFYTDFFVESA